MVPSRFGKYRVLRRLASGGMSEVYLGHIAGEAGFRKRIALKVVHPRHAGDPRFRDLFIREARLAASLSHPNLIQVFDFGKEGGSYFLAMEYVDGWDLGQAAAQARQAGLTFPPGVWRHWVDGIWTGLGHLHDKGIIHRDVSPGNVLLGRTGAVKLTDFGVSCAVKPSGEERDVRAGKLGYLSPERARGEPATVASDLFAAAVVTAELLLGRRLFEGGSAEEVLERVRRFDGLGLELAGTEERVAEAIRTALAADAPRRFRGAADFLAVLATQGPPRATSGELSAFWDALFPNDEEEDTSPFHAAGSDPGPSVVKEPRGPYGIGRRTLAVGVAAAIAALSAGGAVLWMEGRRADRPAVRGTAAARPSDPGNPSAGPATERRAAMDGADGTGTGASPAPAHPSSPSHGRDVAGTPALPGVSEPAGHHWVRVETDPAGAGILLEDGTPAGTTPAKLDTASLDGRGIVLVRDGYARKTVPASALAKVSVLRMELDPILGSVEAIQAIPWARVYVGDRLLGETPLTKVRLAVGEQRLRFVNEPLGVEKTVTVLVRPGNNPKVIVPLIAGGRR